MASLTCWKWKCVLYLSDYLSFHLADIELDKWYLSEKVHLTIWSDINEFGVFAIRGHRSDGCDYVSIIKCESIYTEKIPKVQKGRILGIA